MPFRWPWFQHSITLRNVVVTDDFVLAATYAAAASLAATYAATAASPMVEYVDPAPVVTNAAPAQVIEYVSSAPVIEHIAPALAMTFV